MPAASKYSITPPWRLVLPAVATVAGVAALALTGSAPKAQASELCPAGVVTKTAVTADAQVWDVEGKISGYDTAARTITANGMTFHIPDLLKIKTHDLDQVDGNIELSGPGSLTDPALEASLPITGGTAIASGTVVSTAIGTTGDFCVTFDATSVYVEPAEHGVVGPLLNVDAANGTFQVGGTTVKMNEDPRFPKDLIDLAAKQLTLTQLQGHLGQLVDAVGYFDSNSGQLRGTIVEADVLQPEATTDSVMINSASYKNPELRVRGAISRRPDGTFAANVTLYAGGLDAAGTNCASTSPLATTAIDTADGDGAYEFRLRNVSTNPGAVCVKSVGGGVASIATTLG